MSYGFGQYFMRALESAVQQKEAQADRFSRNTAVLSQALQQKEQQKISRDELGLRESAQKLEREKFEFSKPLQQLQGVIGEKQLQQLEHENELVSTDEAKKMYPYLSGWIGGQKHVTRKELDEMSQRHISWMNAQAATKMTSAQVRMWDLMNKDDKSKKQGELQNQITNLLSGITHSSPSESPMARKERIERIIPEGTDQVLRLVGEMQREGLLDDRTIELISESVPSLQKYFQGGKNDSISTGRFADSFNQLRFRMKAMPTKTAQKIDEIEARAAYTNQYKNFKGQYQP